VAVRSSTCPVVPSTGERRRQTVDIAEERPCSLAVRVNDLQDAWDQLMTREAPGDRSPAECDDLYAFTDDEDHDRGGVMTERYLSRDTRGNADRSAYT
jgi:hypothetical protein